MIFALASQIQKNITFIVLMQMIIFDVVALRCNEIPGPTDCWHEVINAHNLRLHGYFHVELLFGRYNNGKSTSQR